MSPRSKLGIGGFAVIFTLVNLLLFLLFFIPYYVFEENEPSAAYEYFRMYFELAVQWLLPVVSAAVVAARIAETSYSRSILPSFLLSLTNLSYTIPYYYLLGIAGGLDTPQSLLFALAISIGYIVIFTLYTMGLTFIIRISLIRFAAKEIFLTLPKKYSQTSSKDVRKSCLKDCVKKAVKTVPEKVSEGSMFDFSAPVTLGIFFAALMQFTRYFISEVITAVSYLSEYAGSYKGNEIALMIFSFVVLIIMLFVCHITAFLAVKHTRLVSEDFVNRSKSDDDEEEEDIF